MNKQLIMITGASGFIGRHTVDAARKRGHKVIAVVRRTKSIPQSWRGDADITPVLCDLASDKTGYKLALKDVNTVIHTAASLTGGEEDHQRDTLAVTKTVLSGIAENITPIHLVLASSISVYDFTSVNEDGTVDEITKVETNPAKRDDYCRAKLAQEILCKEADLDKLSILRIGAVFGRGRVWNGHIGVGGGPLLLRIGNKGEIPLCYVKHCATALVMAAEKPVSVLNVVDDDLPDRKEFVAVLRQTGWPKFTLPMSWKIFDTVALLLSPISVRMPGLLRRPVLHARMKPLKYSNEKLHKELDWRAQYNFVQAMKEATK